MKKKVCIFDFDGTIIDSMSAFADIAAIVLNKHFGTPKETARKQYISTSGLPFFEQVEMLHPNNPHSAAAVKEFEITKKAGSKAHRPFDDVAPTLLKMHNMGIKTAVSSNNFQELTDEPVKRFGLNFDIVLGWRENFSKGRDHFEYIKQNLNCLPNEMLFIGDSLQDARRALSYGIDFVGKTGTFKRAEFEKNFFTISVIDSLSDLMDILRPDKMEGEGSK